MLVSVLQSREVGKGRRRVRGGGDVSSLTSILPLAWHCVESLCKSHVITPPPAHVCMRRRVVQPKRGRKRGRIGNQHHINTVTVAFEGLNWMLHMACNEIQHKSFNRRCSVSYGTDAKLKMNVMDTEGTM